MIRRGPLSMLRDPSNGLRHRKLALRALALGLLGAGALAAPAAATVHHPNFTLKIEEGATTLPEYEHPDSAYAYLEHSSAEIFLTLIHGGLAVEVGHAKNEGWAGVSGPAVGDELILESPKGTVISRVSYDGLPTMDPTVCAGSTNFSGENSAGEVVEGFYEKKVLETPYHQSPRTNQTAFGEAQVKTLSGTTFSGAFLKPLEAGEDVRALESLKTTLANEETYTYISETERPVAACPAPPPPVIVPAPPVLPPLEGSIAKLFSSKISAFLKLGVTDEVTINQPGTVTQDLYLLGGKLPAFASSRRKQAPPALLLARGSATASTAGKVKVHLRLTNKGRGKLKASHSLKAVLITTLRGSTGVKIDLGRRTITLHR